MGNEIIGETDVLKLREKIAERGEVASKLTRLNNYVHKDLPVSDLAVKIKPLEELEAVAVVDDDEKCVGIITRKKLIEALYLPEGDKNILNKTSGEIAEKVPTFSLFMDIFSLSQKVRRELQINMIYYFVLLFDDEKYYGIINSMDILTYLSAISQKDIGLAVSIQENLIINKGGLVNGDGFTLDTANVISKSGGGDYFQIKNYTLNHWLFGIFNVSGKGLAASVMTSSIAALFDVFDPAYGFKKFILGLNNFICRAFESQKFATAIIADFDQSTNKLFYFDLGHTFIYVYRGGKLFHLKSSRSNMPLGIMEDVVSEPESIQLEPGDILFIMTDGIIEQTDPSGDEYSVERFCRVVTEHVAESPDKIREAVFKSVTQFRGVQPQDDDMSLLILKVE
jgi:sigma-B regulation protein RsbU (phosphoserine phosphatase)